jgi:hypothetical protein
VGRAAHVVDQIITVLRSKSGSRMEALLKTKVLFYGIGRKDLALWVSNELTGYPDDTVPDE